MKNERQEQIDNLISYFVGNNFNIIFENNSITFQKNGILFKILKINDNRYNILLKEDDEEVIKEVIRSLTTILDVRFFKEKGNELYLKFNKEEWNNINNDLMKFNDDKLSLLNKIGAKLGLSQEELSLFEIIITK
jgi:hypothetical protein